MAGVLGKSERDRTGEQGEKGSWRPPGQGLGQGDEDGDIEAGSAGFSPVARTRTSLLDDGTRPAPNELSPHLRLQASLRTETRNNNEEDPSRIAERMLAPYLSDESASNQGGLVEESNQDDSAERKLSMRQVLSHSPHELEADTFLQLALEEAEEATKAEVTQFQESLLRQVPFYVPPQSFRDEQVVFSTETPSIVSRPPLPPRPLSPAPYAPPPVDTSALPPAGNRPPAGRHHRKARSTAESLYVLTRDLEAFQMRSSGGGDASSKANREAPPEKKTDPPRAGGTDYSLEGGESVERMSLLRNAEILLKHDLDGFRRSRVPPPSRIHRWASGIEDPDIGASWNESVTEDKPGHQEAPDQPEKDGEGEDGGNEPGTTPTRPNSGHTFNSPIHRAAEELLDFEEWLRYKRSYAWTYTKALLLFIMLPATAIASILFYLAGNPPCNFETCTKADESGIFNNEYHLASASWWLLFICCRQVITFSMARAAEAFVIDFLAIRTRWAVRVLGPYVTLCIVQSKGWPCTLFFWSLIDFAMLYGHNRFANHWLFYQNAIEMMSNENPSGDIPDSDRYRRLLVLSVILSSAAAIKRFAVGLMQGRRLYTRYGEDLSRVMGRALLISKVGKLARDIEAFRLRFSNFDFNVCAYDGAAADDGSRSTSSDAQGLNTGPLTPGFYAASNSKKARLVELLGEWEEPEILDSNEQNPDIGDIIQFRQSLSYLNSPLPFGLPFGPASTRQECVESSETVYSRLLQCIPDTDVVPFDVLAMLALCDSGELDDELLRKLIKLFRPDREGRLTRLDFVKSVDSVYKDLKLLRASVANASKLGRAFDTMFTFFFYVVLFVTIVAIMGLDPFVMIASFSGFIVGFAFMINIACSSWVQGVLLILVRRPYDIGDRIHISNPWVDTDNTGSPGWIVKDIDLFSTTVVLGATNEVATYNNGSLANFRIINAARSHKAVMAFEMKFPIDCPYEKIQLFRKVVEEFVRARPREWAAFVAFRIGRMEADKGFVEYVGRAQHRESWQAVGAIFQSRADLASFALELAKKMKIRYVSPPMPVDLRMTQGIAPDVLAPDVPDREPTGEDGHRRGGGVSMDDSVIYNVAQMFGTDLPLRKEPKKHFVDDDGGDSD